MSKQWFAVDIDVAPDGSEAAEFALNSLDALGTEIDHLRKSADSTVRVTGYFNDLPSSPAIAAELRHAFAIYSVTSQPQVSTREVEERDWLAEWKRHWKPTESGRFVIAPPWSDTVERDRIVIRIEPQMAFGTGTHETTQLCLRAIGERYLPHMSMLDVGTGTGVLAIAAAKLGGAGILACDTDHDSVIIARENAALNDVADRIVFSEGSIEEEMPEFDLVCANLTIDVILPLLPLLLAKSRELLILSGILVEQEDTIREELEKDGSRRMHVERCGEWISVLAVAKAS